MLSAQLAADSGKTKHASAEHQASRAAIRNRTAAFAGNNRDFVAADSAAIEERVQLKGIGRISVGVVQQRKTERGEVQALGGNRWDTSSLLARLESKSK